MNTHTSMDTSTLTGPPGARSARTPMTPARRLILAIGLPVLAAMIGWTALSIVATAGTGTYQFSRDLPVTKGTLTASLGDGSVTLVQGPSAHITGILTYSLIRPDLTIHGSTVSYRCPVPAGQCSLNSTLTVPRGINVALSSGSGDLTVNGAPGGNISLSTSSGDLTANGLTGSSDSLTTITGNVTASGITAPDVTVNSMTGNITLTFTRAPDQITVRSATGDISIVLPPVAGGYNIQEKDSLGDSSISSGVDQEASSHHLINVTSTTGDISVTSS